MDGRRHEELSDELLEREIEAVLDVEPSPEFLARVRTRVARERVDESWAWRSGLRWAGAALAIAALAVVAVWSLRDPVPPPSEVHISTPTVGPSRTAPDEPDLQNKTRPTLVASADPPTTEDHQDRPAVRTARAAQRQVVARQEVVVSGDEVVALRQLVGAIVARQVKAVDIPALGVESAPLPAIEEIVLQPITLSPMDGTLE
jgi:hypothetical protein